MDAAENDFKSDSPNSLLDLCIACVARNSKIIGKKPVSQLVPPTADPLPRERWQKVLSLMREEGLLDDDAITIFADTEWTRLRSVNVRGCNTLTHVGLDILLQHELESLDLRDCLFFGDRCIDLINSHSGKLVSLAIGHKRRNFEWSARKSEDGGQHYLKAPLLRKLCVWNLIGCSPYLLLKPLPGLTHLDLSGAVDARLVELAFLSHLPSLTSLVLRNLLNRYSVTSAFRNIAKVKTLRHVDVSNSNVGINDEIFDEPDKKLAYLVERLPLLCSLDISGTNLAGKGPNSSSSSTARCDILGLESRVDTPLEYLGLYRTRHNACDRARIPAKKISGNSNLRQALEAGKRFLSRPISIFFAQSILIDLRRLSMYCTDEADLRATSELILLAMKEYPKDKTFQHSCFAGLARIHATTDVFPPDIKLQRRICSSVLDGMLAHKSKDSLLLMGFMFLHYMLTKRDTGAQVIHGEFARLTEISWHVISLELENPAVYHTARYGLVFLNRVCILKKEFPALPSVEDAVDKLMALVTRRVQSGVCDYGLKFAVKLLYVSTKESLSNNDRIVANGGKDLFLQMKEKFKDKILQDSSLQYIVKTLAAL